MNRLQSGTPQALRPRDRMVIVSPSRSIGVKQFGVLARGIERLKTLELQVDLPSAGLIPDVHGTWDPRSRAAELLQALLDPNASAVLTSTGGWSAIDVLEYLDFDQLMTVPPRIYCGFSDATILTTALYAKLGWETYYGPNLATFGEEPLADYTLGYFKSLLMSDGDIRVDPPSEFGEGVDWLGEEGYRFGPAPMRCARPGVAEGRIFGGNLGSLFLLQGTEYWPTNDEPLVLFVEDDDLAGKYTFVEAMRRLQSLLLQPGVRGRVVGLVVGRFQPGAAPDAALVAEYLGQMNSLPDMPIIYDAPFGHTNPVITIPIGGTARIEASEDHIDLSMVSRRG